eukprot:CAMPEP_0115072182 /NCGR_PEP_ID=MMETSP0227-20121206/14082_1 /TAXON_ID=89957 /ORGANISM="Polarella glacialis, Strain CCMP 1383" /LENGTH=888 /DNA_ID=CAMNT_0002458889 /DNA_START=68 /DNA_END=2734 /DNA_ORIENTATION=-
MPESTVPVVKIEASRPRRSAVSKRILGSSLLAAALTAGGLVRWQLQVFSDAELGSSPVSFAGDGALSKKLRAPGYGPFSSWYRPCAITGGTCSCVGTLVFSTILGGAVREVNSDGDMQCTAEALGAPSHRDLRVCWCQDGLAWDDEVRKGLASLVRQGLTPRIEIASDEAVDGDCSADSDGFWYGCVVMSRRWDTSVIPQVMARTASPEEQLDMSLRKLDACHRLAPNAPLRVLGVRSGQSADAVEMPVGLSRVCSVVYEPGEGVMWTAKTSPLQCASEPGSCTTTPCECRRSTDRKLELHTPQGRRCWACAEAGKEYTFRVNALAEQMDGTGVAWWPPYGINCPPILWIFMDWKAVVSGCPVVTGYMFVLFAGLLMRKSEELTGLIPWTRVIPLFGPALKRGEVWRFFTYTFFHLQFLDLFHNLLTLLDTLDVEGTPSIILGDGSNLKCGVGAKQNFMCYPSIGLGSYHTLGVALMSAMVGGMTSTWVKFGDVVTGSSSLGFGLSGAIVALYALYAGADLDKTTSVQRSFQDWVWLRLIFVAFHIAMEWIRGLSQRDAAGLFAHTASFAAGFTYVLYFLPPMGDGTLLAADRPYVVPCAYDQHEGGGAIGNVPECIRLFSAVYEYQVDYVARNAFLLFVATIGFTVFNTVVLQRRVRSSEAVLLAGMEVSAVCCAKRQGGSSAALPSNMEGKDIIVWCEVVGVTGLQPPQGSTEWDQQLEARCIGADPRREPGALLGAAAEAEARTRPLTGGDSPEFKESVFLPVKYQSKSSFVQLVLYDLSQVPKVAVGFAAIPLSQALRFNKRDYSEQKLKLQAVDANRSTIGVSRAKVHVRFRCLEIAQLQRLRRSVKEQIDDGKFKLDYFEQQLAALRQMSLTDAAGGLPADS